MTSIEQQMKEHYHFDADTRYGTIIVYALESLKDQLDAVGINLEYNIGIDMSDLHNCMEDYTETQHSSYIGFHMQETRSIDDQLTAGSEVVTIHWCYYSSTNNKDLFNQIKNVLPSYITMDDYTPGKKLTMRINCPEASLELYEYRLVY
jgi:hypothetical protein